ncbi:MAG: ParB N-terminal domain-containing protein [Oscillospiraceae bacterium]|nr:ParB N-terminal domain-containing protein [Oscillospiraceae bacterium]
MMAINLKNLNKRIENVTASGEKLTTLAHSEEVPTKYIIPAQNNICAKHDTTESIQELADSIAASGLIHDLTVNKISETEYHIISGERRFRAVTRVLKWETVSCRVYEHMSDDHAQLMLLEANLQVRHYSDGELLDFYKEAEQIIERMQVKAPQQALAALLGKSTDRFGSTRQLPKRCHRMNREPLPAALCHSIRAHSLPSSAKTKRSRPDPKRREAQVKKKKRNRFLKCHQTVMGKNRCPIK